MIPFLFTIGTISILIVIGVFVSLYLYRQGAIKQTRLQRSQPAEAYTIDAHVGTIGPFSALGEDMLDPTARYARGGLVVAIACLLMLAMLIATIVNAGLH